VKFAVLIGSAAAIGAPGEIVRIRPAAVADVAVTAKPRSTDEVGVVSASE